MARLMVVPETTGKGVLGGTAPADGEGIGIELLLPLGIAAASPILLLFIAHAGLLGFCQKAYPARSKNR